MKTDISQVKFKRNEVKRLQTGKMPSELTCPLAVRICPEILICAHPATINDVPNMVTNQN